MADLAKPTRVANLSQQAAEAFEARIVSGEWPVGAKIPSEPELMAALGVSRSTVREAVRSLVHARLLEPRPGDGTYVRCDSTLKFPLLDRISHARPREAMEIRAMLEQRAARLAAQRRTPADITGLRELRAAIDHAAAEATTLQEFVATAGTLFTTLAAIARNSLVSEIYVLLLNVPGAEPPAAEWDRAAADRWRTRLSGIIEAVVDGDADRAEAAVRRAEAGFLQDFPQLFADTDRPAL